MYTSYFDGSYWILKITEDPYNNIFVMDKFCRWSDHGSCCSENGIKRDGIMSCSADTTFFLLYCRIYDSFVVFFLLSGFQMECIQDNLYDTFCRSRNFTGKLCESNAHAIVFTDPINTTVSECSTTD